ncbi:PH and SEC7 domain-containing protein 1 [Triplophysa tibetana]|uniref:PH and SEC7 domain-containing protein 1 n=1 Tax=Triplophysa tibetana TaxID=1572043 RepID=A0A5A9P8A9_9TELE|nr:PH and SEC7 domain-containing protein 1 [Triplophysa tibetana]
MSQSGKILHLYVEVRSVADEEAKDPEDMDKTAPLMLTAPENLHQSQNTGHIASHGCISPRGVLHKGSSSTQSLASSKSTSRHSVSFQLHPGHDLEQPASQHRQSLPYDEINQLLSALQSGPPGNTCHPVSASSEHDRFYHDHFYGRESHSSGRFTAPPTPSGTRKGCSPNRRGEEGKRSIATFSYIEKAKIKSVDGQGISLNQSEPQNPFNRDIQNQANIRKRLSDPVGFNCLETMNNCSPKQLSQTMGNSHIGTPSMRRATLDSIAREATHRAIEEFGSPQLRKKLAATCADRKHSIRKAEQRRCRSWSGSPMMPCSSRTLPTNVTLMDQEANSSLYRLPRSPATDQLSNHAKQTYCTMSHLSNVHSQEVSNQRPQGHRCRPNLPSCKPTAIQHELPTMIVTQPSCKKLQGHMVNESPRQANRVNFNLAFSQNMEEGRASFGSGKRSVSPAISSEMARMLAEEATKLSLLLEAKRSPSPTPSLSDTMRSDSPRLEDHSREDQLNANFQKQEYKTGLHFGHGNPFIPHIIGSSPPAPTKLNRTDIISSSPIRDPRIERAQLPGKDSPTLHRYQPFQYARDIHIPGHECVQNETLLNRAVKDSPDSSRRPLTMTNTETSVSWTSQQNPVKGECSSSDKENFKEVENNQSTGTDALGCQVNHFRVSVRHSEKTGDNSPNKKRRVTASQSSSGVTGSLLENTTREKDCVSLETSSKTTQKTSDIGKTSIQSAGGSFSPRASMHSQKIARAKWEFLFGTHSENETKGSFSSGCSSESPTPIIPSSTPPCPISAHSRHCQSSASPKSSSHDVKRIQVEVINHLPAAGSSSKTCIIRRSVKYSETDIDAVPVRSYRETDLDEVMLAEQEEVDSAFGSIRSVLGTSGTSSVSPLDEVLCPLTDGEDELQDEEVVSWASVRMQGDKKRQNASPEGGDVFSRLLRGPSESQPDSYTTLKSPIPVDSPRRTSSDGLDSFSRHFESIVESHRAKGTSYSSLDSEDITPSGPLVFTFDFPTLTPEIQSQICESAKQIIELSFAPLARSESPVSSNTLEPATSQSLAEEVRRGVLEEEKSFSGSYSDKTQKPDSDTDAAIRERPSRSVSESGPGVAERLAVGSTETLTNGNKADLQAAKRLAKRLYNLDGFRKSDVARHMSKNNDFSHMVAEEYLSHFNFTGMTVDQALRVFLREFALMGETQERERVLSHFSRRYLQCNTNSILNEDSVHTLTCAVMLLNTDLHGHNIGKRMSCTQFITNLEGLNDGQNFPKEHLKVPVKSELLAHHLSALMDR